MTLDNWVNTAVAVSTILMVCKMCLEWMYAEARKRKFIMISAGILALVCIKDCVVDFSAFNCFLEVFLSMVAMMLLIKIYGYMKTKEDLKVLGIMCVFMAVFYVAVCLFY